MQVCKCICRGVIRLHGCMYQLATSVLWVLSLAASCHAANPTTATVSAARSFTVCIDPGHPSENADGGTTYSGVCEVQMCWAVALKLRSQLEAQGVRVVMTKSAEREYVTNKHRAEIANAANADLMIRLHTDVSPHLGFATYYPRKQGRTKDGVTGPEPGVLQATERAVKLFYPAFSAELKKELSDQGLKGDEATEIGSKQGALTGSIYCKVPTVLIEMATLNLPADNNWMQTAGNLDKMAHALATGILSVRDGKQD